MTSFRLKLTALAVAPALLFASGVEAHKLRESGQRVVVADSTMSVAPSRDWNRLNGNLGKNTETWTLDSELLNDVTFYGGIPAGKPLVKERSKKRDPLPKVGKDMLLIEVPELLEGTYRTYKGIGAFQTLSVDPVGFLGTEGVQFTYEFVDGDQLTRRGEARAALIRGKLYMITFDAPKLHYFERNIGDFRSLVSTARL